MTKKKTKYKDAEDQRIIEQALGIKLTQRQFKAMLISNMIIGMMANGSCGNKAEAIAQIEDMTEISEAVLERCVLDPLKE